MSACHILQVDETVERELRDTRLGGRATLLDDLRRGHHARTVVAEMNHAQQLRRLGEHTNAGQGCEFRLEAAMHATGFHALGEAYGYDAWDDEDFVRWRIKRFPELRVRYRPRTTTVLT